MRGFFLKLQHNVWYSISMVFLAVLSIGLLAFELFYVGISATSVRIIQNIDLVIAYIFLADFFLGLFFTKSLVNKKTYLKDNWLNLASSVPISSEVFRTFRLLRIFRALRVIRAFMNLKFAEQRREQTK